MSLMSIRLIQFPYKYIKNCKNEHVFFFYAVLSIVLIQFSSIKINLSITKRASESNSDIFLTIEGNFWHFDFKCAMCYTNWFYASFFTSISGEVFLKYSEKFHNLCAAREIFFLLILLTKKWKGRYFKNLFLLWLSR